MWEKNKSVLTEVEFLQEGHAAQHREQAAEEQQQARLPKEIMPPILNWKRGGKMTHNPKRSYYAEITCS